MDKLAALRVLGLTEEKNAKEIYAILANKKADIEKKKSAAPTVALKQKFDEILEKFDLAAEILLTASSASIADENVSDENDRTVSDEIQKEFQPGQLLTNRYEIQELIGKSSIDTAYRALDKNNNTVIAVKILLPVLTQNELALERFLKEAKISASLSHPHIANIYDVQNEGKLYFITMELLEGESLAQLMQTRHQQQHAFSENELLVLMQQLIAALSYAHQYTIHGEIKPENIWINKEGNYKLTDFGLVQLQNISERIQNCSDISTVYYMAPEQIKSTDDIDLRADIYALGIMLYHLATGKVPAGLIKPLQEKRPDLSASFCAAVMQCMEPEVEDRPQTVIALFDLLQQQTEDNNDLSVSVSTLGKNSKSNKLIMVAMIAATIIAIGSLLVIMSQDKSLSATTNLVEQQKIEATKLLGQIESLKKRLDNSVAKLDRDVSEARRNNSQQLNTLQSWQENSQKFVVNSNAITDLEGEQAVGKGYMQDEKQIGLAVTTLRNVKNGYEGLFSCFENLQNFGKQQQEHKSLQLQWKKMDIGELPIKEALAIEQSIVNAVEKGNGCITLQLTAQAIHQYQEANKNIELLLKAETQTMKAQQAWNADKGKYHLENPAAITDAKLAIVKAEKQKSDGLIKEAIASYGVAQQAFSEAKKQVSPQVAEAERQFSAAAKLKAVADAKAAEAKAEISAKAAKEREQQFRKGKTVSIAGSNMMLKGIPAGSFKMGSSDETDEQPIHTVNIKAFYMQETELTWNQYQPCVDAGACASDDDEGYGKGNHPVINVSWNDVQDYIKWLNKKTGQQFRLPSEAEWEYAARATTTSKYSWGDNITCDNAHYDGGKGSACHFAPSGDDSGSVEVKKFLPNAWGLYDMHGNIWEWVQDCWNETYKGAPSNESAWVSGNCEKRVLRGGSWGFGPTDLRSSNRDIYTAVKRYYFFGFRLAQDV